MNWLRMDTVILLWAFSGIVAFSLLLYTPEAVINRLGRACDTTGLYFACRYLVRDLDDIKRLTRMFALALFPLALCFCVESVTGRNPFYAFGGVPEMTVVRRGILRCQGPFAHPILAGTFGAVWLPLFVGLWWQGRAERIISALGIVSCTVITILSGSSGPMTTYLLGILGLAMWPMRRQLRIVRWAILGSLIALHLAMTRPVWFIFARVNILDGSTGWHRANLIDQTVKHFSEWWLVGTTRVMAWGVWAGDITNQYILEGVTGGAITMVLFLWIIVSAFSGLGRAMKGVQFASRRHHLLVWALGATLLAHIMTYFSVSYFDQNVFNWYWLLAAIAAVVNVYACKRTRRHGGSRGSDRRVIGNSTYAGDECSRLPVAFRLAESPETPNMRGLQ